MRFFDRTEEIAKLQEIEQFSLDTAQYLFLHPHTYITRREHLWRDRGQTEDRDQRLSEETARRL